MQCYEKGSIADLLCKQRFRVGSLGWIGVMGCRSPSRRFRDLELTSGHGAWVEGFGIGSWVSREFGDLGAL